MGRLHYGTHAFEMDDRLLAHLQLIIGVKLRRNENFFMAWTGTGSAPGRQAIWIDNGVPIYFAYDREQSPRLNMAWAEKLVNEASRSGGLTISADDLPPDGR